MKKARVTRLLRRGVSFTLYAQEIKNGDPLLAGEAAPEHQPGEFVGIINELADQWAADCGMSRPRSQSTGTLK